MDWSKDARILIVDNNEENALLVREILERNGYQHATCVVDSREVLDAIAKSQPAVILLDLFMPPPDGMEILGQLSLQTAREEQVSVICMGADVPPKLKVKAVMLGASAFLNKPVEQVELLLHLRNLLRTRLLRRELDLERNKRAAWVRSAHELEASGLAHFERVLAVLDPTRAENGKLVAAIATAICIQLNLSAETTARTGAAACVYDIGMLAVPEHIRNSCQVLAADERQLLKKHTIAGATMLEGLTTMQEVALGHHERWDGGGYPNGLKGEQIPLSARIVAVAQAYAALTGERCYRQAFTNKNAIAEICRQAGFAFDPEVVSAFMRCPIVQSEPVSA